MKCVILFLRPTHFLVLLQVRLQELIENYSDKIYLMTKYFSIYKKLKK